MNNGFKPRIGVGSPASYELSYTSVKEAQHRNIYKKHNQSLQKPFFSGQSIKRKDQNRRNKFDCERCIPKTYKITIKTMNNV